jgi:hypothetical protein
MRYAGGQEFGKLDELENFVNTWGGQPAAVDRRANV